VRDFEQGVMAVSLDTGAARSIDDHSAMRNASGIVFTSAVLASGRAR
jgi:hypothetical protein